MVSFVGAALYGRPFPVNLKMASWEANSPSFNRGNSCYDSAAWVRVAQSRLSQSGSGLASEESAQ